MATDTANRKTARKNLGALLQTALTGPGNPAQEVFDYKKGQIAGGPTILVYSGPSIREQQGATTERFNSAFYLIIDAWIPDADEAGGWTEEQVDDALDDINKAIADVIGDNRSNAAWSYLDFENGARSIIIEYKDEAGLRWLIERFTVVATFYDG